MPGILESIADVDTRYSHIYFSPHFDDAVLSCGGAIAKQTRAAKRVLIVTTCAGAPSADVSLGAFAARLHDQWGLSPGELATVRRGEDQAAAACVGADLLWLDFREAIYRSSAGYGDDAETLFGPLAPGDPLPGELTVAIAEIAARCPLAALHAPLGVGAHVDHCIVHAAASSVVGRPMSFYDDYPYVAYPDELPRRLEALAREATWNAVVEPVDDTLAARIDAIRQYRSQLGMLFGTEEIMALFVTEFARSLSPAGATFGERSWVRSVATP